MKISALQRKHPDYSENHSHWEVLLAISKGGSKAQKYARQLLANPDGRKEKVIKEMIKVAPVINKLGPLINRVNSKVFSDKLSIEGTNEPWLKTFLESGGRYQDKRNMSFEEVIRQAAMEALTTSRSYLQVDTSLSSGSTTLAQQDESELRPYVNLIDRLSVWDWEPGEAELSMVKIHSFRLERSSWESPRIGVHEFTVYRKEGGRILFSKYEVRLVKPTKGEEGRPFIDSLKDEGAGKIYNILVSTSPDGRRMENMEVFNLAGQSKFPIIQLDIPYELCIGDQLFGLQREHYNNRVGGQWKLQRGNFAMPYAKGGDEDPFASKTIGDGFYFWVPDEEVQFGELSVSGDGVNLALRFEEVIDRDFYEFIQQLSFAAQQKAAALARSENSRFMDEDPENALLAQIGLPILKTIRSIMSVAAIAANDIFNPESWEIKGLQNFRLKELQGYMPLFKDLATIPVPTPSFGRQKMKDLINRYATTFNIQPERLKKLIEDVDNLPDSQVMEVITASQPDNPQQSLSNQ